MGHFQLLGFLEGLWQMEFSTFLSISSMIQLEGAEQRASDVLLSIFIHPLLAGTLPPKQHDNKSPHHYMCSYTIAYISKA